MKRYLILRISDEHGLESELVTHTANLNDVKGIVNTDVANFGAFEGRNEVRERGWASERCYTYDAYRVEPSDEGEDYEQYLFAYHVHEVAL